MSKPADVLSVSPHTDIFDVYLAGADDPIRVAVDGRDIRAWEAETGQSWIEITTYTSQVEVAHLAAARAGVFEAGRSEWMARCTDLVKVREAAPVRPTQPAP